MSALLGDFMFGVQPLWPPAPVTMGDVFAMPSWERPTPETGYTPPEGSEVFEGAPGFQGGGTPSGSPGFTGAPTLGSTWTMPAESDTESGGIVTTVQADGSVVSMEIRASRTRLWRIEVRDADGELISTVPQWISGRLRRKLDQASTLEFRIAYDAEGAADLVRPNTVWLRDRWGFVADTFQIQRRKPVGQGDGSFIDYVCQGAISQLAEEVVIQYGDDTAGVTTAEHVAALMALQVKAGAIEVGEIDTEIGSVALPFFAMDTSIHAALLQLQMALPREVRGRIYVDARRRLQWRLAPGDQTEQVITRGRNIFAIEAETDYSSVVNRLYMYGDGLDARSRLKLTDAGEVEEYLDDAESIAAYGLCPAIKVDRRIRYPETLLRVGTRVLEEFSEPQVQVRVDLLDLAKADDAPAGWRDIEIGGKYRAVDTTLGIDSSIEIVGIETDLARPVPIRVELANQTKTLGDLIAGLVEALQQPLDVDGDRYPTMGRNYTAQEPRNARAGDTRWKTDHAEMYDGAEWKEIASADDVDEYHHEATSKVGLRSAASVPKSSIGYVTEGTQKGMVCVVNTAGTGWVAVNVIE